MLTNLHAWQLERLDCGLIKGMARRPTIAKTTKTNAGCAADRVQLATYPQSPFSGPGRLWISLGAVFVIRLDALWGSTRKAPTKTSITPPFQDSSRKNKNSNHRSAESAKPRHEL